MLADSGWQILSLRAEVGRRTSQQKPILHILLIRDPLLLHVSVITASLTPSTQPQRFSPSDISWWNGNCGHFSFGENSCNLDEKCQVNSKSRIREVQHRLSSRLHE
jgi:hypothetical protein